MDLELAAGRVLDSVIPLHSLDESTDHVVASDLAQAKATRAPTRVLHRHHRICDATERHAGQPERVPAEAASHGSLTLSVTSSGGASGVGAGCIASATTSFIASTAAASISLSNRVFSSAGIADFPF